jgi:N-acyl-L-homoserine lactone synthetase
MAVAGYLEGLTFKIASAQERESALDLRRQIYTAEHGKSGIDDLDAIATHLVAVDARGAVVSTLRILGPRQRPFDLEHFVSVESILPAGSIPAEISRFCVEKSHRVVHRGQAVHLGMLKLLYEFACRQGITDLLTLVLPGVEKIYEAVLFVRLPIVIDHPTWGAATLMLLNLDQARQKSADHPIAKLLFHTSVPNVLLKSTDR